MKSISLLLLLTFAALIILVIKDAHELIEIICLCFIVIVHTCTAWLHGLATNELSNRSNNLHTEVTRYD